MNTKPKRPNRKLFLWPLGGIVLGAMAASNPFYAPWLSFSAGVVVWCVAMVVALTLAANPLGARIAVLITGMLMVVPCHLVAPALLRALLMCFAALPFFIALAAVLFPEIAGFRARIYFLCTWQHSREVKRRPSRFNVAATVQLVAATAVFAACFSATETVPGTGGWLLVKCLAFGFVILAYAEMATACQRLITGWIGLTMPALMDSPYLSMSVNEFWTRRWNPAAAMLFRTYFYNPLARRGTTLAMFVTFFVSGIAHALLVFMAIGEWSYAVANGAFFCVQPIFIMIERRMNIRSWRPTARHAWTISVLAITSPLFVAPALQVVGRGWGDLLNTPSANVLLPTVITLAFVICMVAFFSLASWVSCPEPGPRNSVLQSTATAP